MTDESKRAVAWRCRSWGADEWAYFDGDDKPETVPAAQLEPLYASQPASDEAANIMEWAHLYMVKPERPSEFDQVEARLKAFVNRVDSPAPEAIEDMCARIKAADDAAADGGYMLDSKDCIAVLRGTWNGPLAMDMPAKPSTVEQAIAALVTALAASKGWMRDYADAIIRDAIDRKPEACKSLNALAADLLRPYLKPGQKVIWREAFRWHDDNGVLSNHYDGMEIESLAADFGYDWNYEFNFKHAAIVSIHLNRASPAAPNEGLSQPDSDKASKREMTDAELAALNARELELQAIERAQPDTASIYSREPKPYAMTTAERVAWVKGHSAGWDAAKNGAEAWKDVPRTGDWVADAGGETL